MKILAKTFIHMAVRWPGDHSSDTGRNQCLGEGGIRLKRMKPVPVYDSRKIRACSARFCLEGGGDERGKLIAGERWISLTAWGKVRGLRLGGKEGTSRCSTEKAFSIKGKVNKTPGLCRKKNNAGPPPPKELSSRRWYEQLEHYL